MRSLAPAAMAGPRVAGLALERFSYQRSASVGQSRSEVGGQKSGVRGQESEVPDYRSSFTNRQRLVLPVPAKNVASGSPRLIVE